MTFLQYMTRRSGFGRTPWLIAIVLQLAAIAMLWYGISHEPDGSTAKGWTIGFGVVITIIIWVGTWLNYGFDQTHTDRNPNQHYPDVYENANPPTMKDGSPITDPVKWVACYEKCSREEAALKLDDDEEGARLILAHQEYLKKFRQ